MRLAFLGLTIASLLPALPIQAQRAPIETRQGVVASAHELASQAGIEILRDGGNAVDAAAATGLALAVVYPIAGNLGGGGFMLIHLADGRDLAVDYRETAPAAAARNMYLGPDGRPVQGPGSSTLGWKASGVPGSVAGFALAVEKYGSHKVTWGDICEPARRLAAEGHIVSQDTADRFRSSEEILSQFDESKRIFLKAGAFLKPGEKWVQADLANTLARLQKHGPSEFYERETARRIADAMAAHGGNITLADLRNYRVVERTPLRGRYRGYDIVTMPPPSSGGVALLQMLGMLEAHDVASLGCNSASRYHLFAEVMKRAFRDRAEYLGDPDFIRVPVERLLDPAYIRGRMLDFSPDRATPAAAVPPGLGEFVAKARRESNETTHFSVVDSAGNAVSNTYTLNGAFGSGVTIPGTGILMNNQMDDFTSAIGVPNAYGLIQGEANAIEPGKRPLSSMTPTFVFKDGRAVLVTGSPGGPTIINTVLEVITNFIDWGMDVQKAVDTPRFSEQWMPDVISYESGGLPPEAIAGLKERGHTLRELSRQGDAETIAIDPTSRLIQGASDPRNPDAKAVGY
jgi:gamma-glutamyltranspeptidase/glutathione hydrolase